MPPDYSRIAPWIIAAIVAFAIYRRFRRNFGRQLLRPTRMILRIVILLLLMAVLAPAALRGADFAAAEGLGALIGIGLALFGASRTRFAREGERLFYIPHTITGVAVSALLLGRIVYRISSGGYMVPDGQAPDARAAMVKSPLTVGLFLVLIGYYACYYGWLLWKSKRITAADLEASSTPSSSAPDPLLPS
jgi:hypothetical protein